jgi:hypothetical protein
MDRNEPMDPAATDTSPAANLSRFVKHGWSWAIVGAVYGLAMRLLLGKTSPFGPMSVAFIIATPIVVGALTVYGGRHKPQSVLAIIFRPWASVALMLLGCAVSLIEGSICIALLSPLFLVLGTIGGVGMAIALRVARHNQSRLKAVAVLPLLLLAIDSYVPLSTQELSVRQSVVVDAAPGTIWKQILTARDIRPDEFPFSLTYLIGVPHPAEGINRPTAEGEVRFSRWERGVEFQALVTRKKENESITWNYRFDGHSFPPGSMDEHVAIGGRYFDLRDTTFNLVPRLDGRTELQLVAHYRVTSSIGFYAIPAATVLGNDFVHSILSLYKKRSEEGRGPQSPGG